MSPKKLTYDFDLTKPKEIVKDSWLYNKERYFEWFHWFWLTGPLQFLFGTELNRMTNAHEWRLGYWYRKKDLFYHVFWVVFFLTIYATAGWVVNFYNLVYFGSYLTGQNILGESMQVDKCAGNITDHLSEYFQPIELTTRTKFSSLRKISDTEKLQGFAHNVYYAPTRTETTITFQTMMKEMRRWVIDTNRGDKCVCFFHFGVGIQGGFYEGTFFISPEIIKEAGEYLAKKIGGYTFKVPERASVVALGDKSCSLVETKLYGGGGNACIAFCGS